jgi:hypothetical protein
MYKIEKKDNYFVVTDTVTGQEEIREPRDQIKWKKDTSNDYTFYYNIPNLTAYSDGVIALGIDYKSFAFADIVDSTSTAFASVTALDTFLEQTTGKICCTDSEVSAGSASGVYEGFVVTINALDATKIDISAGRAVWVDFWSNPPNPITYDFSVAAQTGVSVTNLLTSTQSYIGVDYTGTFFQYSSRPDNEEGRNVLVLAQLGHADNTTVKSVNDYTAFYDSPHETIRDLIWEFKLINDGNTVYPNGNNLNINKTAGALFGMGINRTANIKNPNKRTNAALTVAPFRYRTQTGGTTANVTLIDPTKYDNAGTITNVPAVGTNATNQRVYLFPNNNIVIQYGQTVYSSLALAVQGVQSESFTVFENVAEGAILIGIISVRRDAVHLANVNQAKFIPVSKFGENIGGASGISTSNLQQAYDNSVDPEILTNSTLGAVSFKRGSVADTDDVIEILNGSGAQKAYFKGNGELRAETYKNLPFCIQLAASDETTALTIGTGKVTFRIPFAMTLTEVRASLTTAQTSGSIFTVDINENGTSVLSTKITIDNTEKTSTTATTPAVISDSSLAVDSEMTIDIDQVGDGTAKGLKIALLGII